MGDVLEASGADLSNYRRNPIVLFNHDPSHPVGTASLSRNGNAIDGVITFAPQGASQKSDEVCELAKAGVLSGVSVGFDPIDASPYPLGFRITKWELLEVSLVAIPCNPSARVLERRYGSSSRAERLVEIAELCERAGLGYRDATPAAPSKLTERQKFILNEHNRALDMSARLYERDPDVQKAERVREIRKLTSGY